MSWPFCFWTPTASARKTPPGASEVVCASPTDSPTLPVSIGFSVYPVDGLSASELLKAADKRPYQSKKSRNSGEHKLDPQRTESART
jgi:GGDEF domain-containing protein